MKSLKLYPQKKPKITIRQMQEDELGMVMGWADEEGWNPGKYDYKAYYAIDKKGFLLLLLDNRPVGAISLVRYSHSFAFIGLFIVRPEFRKQGYGKQLWDVAMNRLAKSTSIGLYAVPQQVDRYKNSGFQNGHKNNRWNMAASFSKDMHYLMINQKNIVKPYKKLVDYDKSLWGSSRKRFFDLLLMQTHVHAFVRFNELSGNVNGYGVIRPCSKGYRIGPLYADSLESAKELTESLLSKIPCESQVIFDIPTKNYFSNLFAEYFVLERIEDIDTQAMFKGEIHNQNEDKCYGVCSLEIG